MAAAAVVSAAVRVPAWHKRSVHRPSPFLPFLFVRQALWPCSPQARLPLPLPLYVRSSAAPPVCALSPPGLRKKKAMRVDCERAGVATHHRGCTLHLPPRPAWERELSQIPKKHEARSTRHTPHATHARPQARTRQPGARSARVAALIWIEGGAGAAPSPLAGTPHNMQHRHEGDARARQRLKLKERRAVAVAQRAAPTRVG